MPLVGIGRFSSMRSEKSTEYVSGPTTASNAATPAADKAIAIVGMVWSLTPSESSVVRLSSVVESSLLAPTPRA